VVSAILRAVAPDGEFDSKRMAPSAG